jgi:leader peptidase (prepilin peptidase)/N-methyltransferase
MDSSLILPVLAGLLSAFLVNFLADELPRTRALTHPACRNCGTSYPWIEYLGVRDCGKCGFSRGLRPWVVLGGMLALSLFAWLQPHRLGFAAGIVLLTYFAVVIVIDIEHRLILQPTSVFGALLALGIGLWLHGILPTVLGGLAGFAIMAGFYYLGVLFTRLRSRRLAAAGQPVDGEEALGGGDVTLSAILGMLLGWPLIWFGLLMGVLLGGIIGFLVLLVAILRGQYGSRAFSLFMPYAPSFVLSAFLIMFVPALVGSLLPR